MQKKVIKRRRKPNTKTKETTYTPRKPNWIFRAVVLLIAVSVTLMINTLFGKKLAIVAALGLAILNPTLSYNPKICSGSIAIFFKPR